MFIYDPTSFRLTANLRDHSYTDGGLQDHYILKKSKRQNINMGTDNKAD
jgi:hypothetical protein